jgi:glycosyltransferase involved in cell wall biosynthesis
MNKIVVFDSHPVQYRVPVWKSIEFLLPSELVVIYASDCSVKGYSDCEFGQVIAWDEPMLMGYKNLVLNCESGKPLSGWSSLTGKGISQSLDKFKPQFVLLTGLNYKYDWVALWESKKRNIPIILRCETQDEASERSKFKYLIRYILYFLVYKMIYKILYIGNLNKEHYLKHGVSSSKLFPAKYATVDRFLETNFDEKTTLRANCRSQFCIDDSKIILGFSGKLIPKKNPEILFKIIEFLPNELRNKICIYFLGSGELDIQLKQTAINIQNKFGIKSVFTGFLNQTQMPSHYLAMDILVLPSRKMGETWGLVVNEALQAGCGVVVSDAVGCHKDFNTLERFRVFPEGDAKLLACRVEELSKYERDFNWAQVGLNAYSIESTAKSILQLL